MRCIYCAKPDCEIPTGCAKPMCMGCWVIHTLEGKQFESDFYTQQAIDDIMLRRSWELGYDDYIDEGAES